jgi:hypothetical protein
MKKKEKKNYVYNERSKKEAPQDKQLNPNRKVIPLTHKRLKPKINKEQGQPAEIDNKEQGFRVK